MMFLSRTKSRWAKVVLPPPDGEDRTINRPGVTVLFFFIRCSESARGSVLKVPSFEQRFAPFWRRTTSSRSYWFPGSFPGSENQVFVPPPLFPWWLPATPEGGFQAASVLPRCRAF